MSRSTTYYVFDDIDKSSNIVMCTGIYAKFRVTLGVRNGEKGELILN